MVQTLGSFQSHQVFTHRTGWLCPTYNPARAPSLAPVSVYQVCYGSRVPLKLAVALALTCWFATPAHSAGICPSPALANNTDCTVTPGSRRFVGD